MPHDIMFENIPIGIAVSGARKGESKVTVASVVFSSSEDGHAFVERLEGFPNEVIQRLPPAHAPLPSEVTQMLVIVRPDKSATVYINSEVKLLGTVQAKRKLNAGDLVLSDDITDLTSIRFEDISIPETAGVLWLFSVGWRRGLFFDFSPLGPERVPRAYGLEPVFGECFAHVVFQELFRITELQWEALLEQQWFPFRALKMDLIKKILSAVKQGWPIDDLLDVIVQEVTKDLEMFLSQWSSTKLFEHHLPILSQAIERFRGGDFISCTSLLFPRIEGILRSIHAQRQDPQKATQSALAKTAVNLAQPNRHGRCALLPENFERYLSKVYFAAFDPTDPKIRISRNSVSHGVVAVEEMSAKAAAIALLIIQQIFYYVQPFEHQTTP